MQINDQLIILNDGQMKRKKKKRSKIKQERNVKNTHGPRQTFQFQYDNDCMIQAAHFAEFV